MSTTTSQKLGKYSIVEKIGHGAMGEVFKARDEVLNRSVALKTIASSAHFADQELSRFFHREAQAAAGLNHPNIVTVFDFGDIEGRLYLVMELLEGSDLLHVIREKRLRTLEAKVELMRRIADGMAYAHARGFLHRDLKPANIRVLPDGTPKILDFGLARTREAEATRTGRVVGTPHYMAPEQIKNEAVDTRADVFALGVLFYELLTGQRPFPATDLHGVLFQILQREPEPARNWAPHLPASLEEILHRALAKDPEERYRDASELHAALDALDPEELQKAPAEAPPAPSESTATASRPPSSGTTTSLSGPPVRVIFCNEDDGDRALWLKDKRQSLLALSLDNGISHYHECGGRARCSSCRVRVLSGHHNLRPRTKTEERLAHRLGWTDDIRLACQTRVDGEVEVRRLVHDTQDLGLMLPSKSHALAPCEKPLAVLHCELIGFKEHVERLPAYDLFHALNRFYLQVGEAAIASGGRIETYTEAGFRVLFGLDDGVDEKKEGTRAKPGSAREKCLAAVRAAIRAVARMESFRAYSEKFLSTRFEIGIGLDFTRLLVGQLGHPSKTEIATLGPATRLGGILGEVHRRNEIEILATEGFINIIEEELRLGRVLTDEELGGHGSSLYEVLDLSQPDAAFIVQRTFELCEGRTEEMSEIFYELLFTLAPEVRKLFEGTDMRVQKKMLMETLGAAVRSLDNVEGLIPTLRELGRRHAGYGVELFHYDLLEHVLIETVQRMIGEKFTEAVRLAWTRIYNVIVQHMTESIAVAA